MRKPLLLVAFSLSIATVDADGVALTAIQGLNAKVDEQAHAAEIAALKHAVEALLARVSSEGKLASR